MSTSARGGGGGGEEGGRGGGGRGVEGLSVLLRFFAE